MTVTTVSVSQCHDCGTSNRSEDEFCHVCGGATIATEVRGQGTVYSWTTVHRSLGAATDAPYAVLSVDLEVGARVLGRLCPESSYLSLDAGLEVRPCQHSRWDRLEFQVVASAAGPAQ